MRSVDFRTSRYHPGIFLFLGVMLLIISIVVGSVLFAGFTLVVISLLILTTHYRLSINFESKTYHDYLSILWFKKGDKQKFDRVEYIFIKKRKMSQTMSYKSISSTVRSEVHTAFLKFSEEDKIELMTKNSKEALLKKTYSNSKQPVDESI